MQRKTGFFPSGWLRSLKSFFRFRSTVFGRVIIIISVFSMFLFLLFGLIFNSVYQNYLNTVIRQSGNNVGSMVEGALYHAMLKNDKDALQNTLDVINTLPGIDEVNMYNSRDSLAYSSVVSGDHGHGNPDCRSCHSDLDRIFPHDEHSYHIIDDVSTCSMMTGGESYRQLLIRSPIFNEKSCYTAACHAHSQSDVVLGSLIIKVPLKEMDAEVADTTRNFFLLAAISTFLLVSMVVLFTRKKIRKPLDAMLSASQTVAGGDIKKRLEITPDLMDDMRTLAISFNNMLDSLGKANKELENWSQQLEYKVKRKSEEITAIQQELIHAEKMASLGRLSSSVAHEINNPLSGVLTCAKLVQKQLKTLPVDETAKAQMEKYLTVIEKETKRCGDIVRDLLDFSRKDRKRFANHHVHSILSDACHLMSYQIKSAGIHFYTDFSADRDLVFCNENQIKQACVAVLVNAVEAVGENGEITIKTLNPDPEHLRLEISDDGTGISPEHIKHIFEPFFSARQNAGGIGMGLAIVHGIVENHHGKITITSKAGAGTAVAIKLPLAKKLIPEDHDKKNITVDRG